MDFSDFLKTNLVCLDGATGTLLQRAGLKPGDRPEDWNLSHPETIRRIHREYFDAGANVVGTCTFGANTLKYSAEELRAVIRAAVDNAAAAREESSGAQEKFIALDIGPTGKMLKPFGDLDFEDAVAIFAQTVRIGVECGVDLIFIETMSDGYETKAALLAAKENSALPVLLSNAYGKDCRLMSGADVASITALAESMGAAAIGANCSLGPAELRGVIDELLLRSSIPVLFKPNAGLPHDENGEAVFDVSVEEFAREIKAAVEKGVRVFGGCCGTTPAFIRKCNELLKDVSPKPLIEKNLTVISSRSRAVEFGGTPVLIGERINPTGKKRLKQALLEHDVTYVLDEGINQCAHGAEVLDVNVGVPGIDEGETLRELVRELQNVTEAPLQIDTSSPSAMEKALRIYNGKALVNSVNGKRESMEAIFPLVKKYGGTVIALTLDESGIPATIAGRMAIARRIINCAAEYGISKKDLIFDTLAMSVSADAQAARITLETLREISQELGCRTSLGVSNVSFGLPNRDCVNAVFFAMALENGLSAAIMNPYSTEMLKTYHAFCALNAQDENCAKYISFAGRLVGEGTQSVALPAASVKSATESLRDAIVAGLAERAGELTQDLLARVKPLDIVTGEIVPALDKVGVGFERKEVYLPQLLMSAEAAKKAFEKIKAAMPNDAESAERRDEIVLATVKGDIHDIGKNIVRMMLENYGFGVVDLGKDVPPQTIVDYVVTHRVPLVGLSALMTTTVPAMAETVAQLHRDAPDCKIVVGGAVLNAEYAATIGADKYAADAMETVRWAEELLRGK